jgi:cation diffusion facilitator CzcD-associated flavoprotein CzcO
VRAATLITGTGSLSEPRLPDIDGLADFGGRLFHSARWEHDAELAGKRVAVIGTGASAIQIVPELAGTATHLDVYQRTAPWVLPRADRRYTRVERLLLRHVPAFGRLYRAGVYWGRESYVPAFTLAPWLVRPAERIARRHLQRAIGDPDLRRRLTPDHALGCKRALLSNDYYPALALDHVDLVTDRIVRVTRDAIVTVDAQGVESARPVDVIVVATGFHATDRPVADLIRGRDDRLLAEEWREHGMAAYQGTTVHGFPNLFMLVGPNTVLGHSSMVFVIEAQVDYLVGAIRAMRESGWASVEPTRSAQDHDNASLQRRMRRTVWSTGCASWYLDRHGRNTTLWPRSTVTLRARLARFDADAYAVTSPGRLRETMTG